MQGIFISGRRPKSKKEVKDAIRQWAELTAASGLHRGTITVADVMLHSRSCPVSLEATSVFGNEYSGPVDQMPEGKTITFVGPDPYTSRKFYGQIVRNGDRITVK